MTRKEKKAWDLGFSACDSGKERHAFPRSLSNVESEAWLRGWDCAFAARHGPHAPKLQEAVI